MGTNFDAEAAEWDTPEKVARSRTIAGEIARRVPLDPAWTVLDVGAGTGQLALALGPEVSRVILVDTSEGMLDVAQHHTADDPQRYDVRCLDLTTESLGEPVDLVVSAMTLHHVPDTRAILTAFREGLAPGGWVALADLDADPENHFHADDHDGHRGIDRHDLAAMLGELGFEDIEVDTAARATKTKHGVEREFTVFLATGHLRP